MKKKQKPTDAVPGREETDPRCSDFGAMTQPDLTPGQIARKGVNKQFDAMIESFYDGIWVVDSGGIVLNVNSVALTLHGLKEGEIVGRHVTELVQKGIVDRSSSMEALNTGKRVHMVQYLAKNKRYLLVTATPIFDDIGGLSQVIVIDRDMTDLAGMWERLEHTLMLQGSLSDQLLTKGMMEMKGMKVVAESKEMKRVLMIALRLGQLSVSNILLLGESGTGKGLLAKFIHENSPRKSQPFIQVNCAALPEGLVEAELFGYERGAFTGAKSGGKIGLLELSRDGTAFLDEIGELQSATQAKLLKCIDEREIMPLGGLKTKRIQCSIITATNRDLEDLVKRGLFREDLYYRLNSFNIKIPPLRERPADIDELAKNFLFACNQSYRTEKQISSNVFDRLKNYRFPGNVRELDNLIRNAVVMTDTNILDEYIQDYINNASLKDKEDSIVPTCGPGISLFNKIEEAELSLLKDALERCNSTRAVAKYLGTSQATVVRKLRKYKLRLSSKSVRSL